MVLCMAWPVWHIDHWGVPDVETSLAPSPDDFGLGVLVIVLRSLQLQELRATWNRPKLAPNVLAVLMLFRTTEPGQIPPCQVLVLLLAQRPNRKPCCQVRNTSATYFPSESLGSRESFLGQAAPLAEMYQASGLEIAIALEVLDDASFHCDRKLSRRLRRTSTSFLPLSTRS